ncbi:hypothetical protein PHYC_00834 [Phycisphaerales bacterium]|nr:hypothetical protein PHYC_00834 [Phycisphaerales bacterium]
MSKQVHIAFLVLAAGSSAASAQNALGDGRSLERTTQSTGILESRRLDFANEVRMRNAIVTGSATDGRSLQIASPYADVDEFRAALGSDSLFRFRRDTYSSGTGVGFRGTESLQYQYAFTTGNARDSGIFNRLAGITTNLSTPPAERVVYSSTVFDRGGADSVAPDAGTLRSTASFSATRGLSPALIGYRQTREGFERMTASTLLGVRNDLLIPDLATQRYVEKNTPALAVPPASTAAPTDASGEPASTPLDSAAPARTAYDDLLERLKTREGDKPEKPEPPTTPPTTPPPAIPEPPPPEAPGFPTDGTKPPAAADRPAWEINLDAMREHLIKSGLSGGPRPMDLDPDSDENKKRMAFAGVDDELLESIRQTGGRVQSYLAANPNPGDLYAEHVSQGEKLIGTRKFFDAEEQFARALAMRPGDVTAMQGRLHAQIGAGLYLSAAMNLRTLFEQHPEVLGVVFSGSTMPEPERLTGIKNDLTAALDRSAAKKALASPESALLLAYLGFQTNDRPAIERGLGTLERERAAQAAQLEIANPEPDPLLALLRRIWLAEKPQEEPAK